MSVRATLVFFAVAAFASCEAQELELVPEEPSALETPDAGATGGTVATGGKTSSGGRLATGGSAATGSGGKVGAGGGPGTGGMIAGAGGFTIPVFPCQKMSDCEVGYCENSACVDCRFSGCKEPTACNTFNGRCEPSCDERNDCNNNLDAKQCDVSRHLCVECVTKQDCEGRSTEQVCARNIGGYCVECVDAADCGAGNRCNPRGDCKCVDDTGCGPDRCDPNTHECVQRQ